ncbi:hypothetical protein [Halomicronema sp. CCY15110]|uniref:hypothetical protein n=1 Tax=Halomicronema sp. CCY15110 TaxID=2767773 RepID=UPI00194ED19C|nr:hypothetical protein [Halomicronema sp. CCY15110]
MFTRQASSHHDPPLYSSVGSGAHAKGLGIAQPLLNYESTAMPSVALPGTGPSGARWSAPLGGAIQFGVAIATLSPG